MKIWSWARLEKEFKKHPEHLKAFQEVGDNYTSFEEGFIQDIQKCDIVAAVIGCHCEHDLKKQQKEAMEHRESVCGTPKEWFERLSSDHKYGDQIERIIKRFSKQKRCHRNYEGERAGIRCYCDEHAHQY